jgi:hypothetical protein
MRKAMSANGRKTRIEVEWEVYWAAKSLLNPQPTTWLGAGQGCAVMYLQVNLWLDHQDDELDYLRIDMVAMHKTELDLSKTFM